MSQNQHNGVAIILNRPSRMDKQFGKLFSGTAGDWFIRELHKVGLNLKECVVSLSEKPNIPDTTKAIFLLGDESLRLYKQDVSLGEQRGSPFLVGDIPVIASYSPQDSHDMKNYEATLNPGIYDVEDEKEDDTDTGKAHGKTARSNYKFWLSKDIRKVARIARLGLNVPSPRIEIFPSFEEIWYDLTTNKGKDFFVDIENDPETLDLTVKSYCFLDLDDENTIPVIKTVPFRRWNYTTAYDEQYKILVALAIAMRDNRTVTHNGAQFDIFVITYKHKIPFGRRHFDTMVSHHRNFPEIEKSLGHCISLYTDLPYHKNTSGTFTPFNTKQEYALWHYNALDVFSMVYVKRGILRHAKMIDSVKSIEQANRSIPVYLTITFTGIRIDQEAINKKIEENDRRVNCLLKILEYLVGRPINPRSNVDMPHYLFEKKDKGGLGLKPVSYSQDTGKPKCDAKALIKIYVKYPNIVTLRLVLEIRRLQKECEALQFRKITW
jgi:hypothetical protein